MGQVILWLTRSYDRVHKHVYFRATFKVLLVTHIVALFLTSDSVKLPVNVRFIYNVLVVY